MKLYVIYDYKSKYPDLSGSALTDALIRECLGREGLVIERTDKGKPYIKGPGSDGICISVSHSEGTFALLVSERNVGLDIQYRRDVKADSIAARCFPAEEAAYVAEDGTGSRFFTLWTRKEAYSKYTGLGMEQIMRKEPVPDDCEILFTDLRLEDGCYCSICSERIEEGGQKPDEIQISYRK